MLLVTRPVPTTARTPPTDVRTAAEVPSYMHRCRRHIALAASSRVVGLMPPSVLAVNKSMRARKSLGVHALHQNYGKASVK
jgi:hypothetical protein